MIFAKVSVRATSMQVIFFLQLCLFLSAIMTCHAQQSPGVYGTHKPLDIRIGRDSLDMVKSRLHTHDTGMHLIAPHRDDKGFTSYTLHVEHDKKVKEGMVFFKDNVVRSVTLFLEERYLDEVLNRLNHEYGYKFIGSRKSGNTIISHIFVRGDVLIQVSFGAGYLAVTYYQQGYGSLVYA